MNVRILFITFHGTYDYIGNIVDSFNDLINIKTHDQNDNLSKKILEYVSEFPYLTHKNNDNLTDRQLYKLVIDNVNKNKITHVFWFFFPDVNILKMVQEKTIAKNVFYNFDDPKSFNIFLVKNLEYVDYFINPLKQNEKKYTYIIGKPTYTVPMYVDRLSDTSMHMDKNLEGFTGDDFDVFLESNGHDEIDNIENEWYDKHTIVYSKSDVAILIDDDYACYDIRETETINNYIQKIRDYCMDNNISLNIYGLACIENLFPDIYIGPCELLDFVGNTTSLIIILDTRYGLDKCTNKLFAKFMPHGVPILSNPHQSNDPIYLRGLMKNNDTHGNDITILSPENLGIIKTILDNHMHNNVINDKRLLDSQIPLLSSMVHDVKMWTNKILHILMYKQ